MKNPIILSCSYRGQPLPDTPAGGWYTIRSASVSAEFVVESKGGQWVSLMNFAIPKTFTQLVPNSSHPTGADLSLKPLSDWQAVQQIDATPFVDDIAYLSVDEDVPRHVSINMQPPSRDDLVLRRKTLLEGWLRLVCLHLQPEKPDSRADDIVHQLPFWENFLSGELADYSDILNESIKKSGIASTLIQSHMQKEINSWKRRASCTSEILVNACPNFPAVLCVASAVGQYPALTAGYSHLQWVLSIKK